MRATILITGFGPFPGAPYNPTVELVTRLAQLRSGRRWRMSKIVSHIFETSYAAVDRDLPALLARHKPDALLMFGLAARRLHPHRNAGAQRAGSAARCFRRSAAARTLLRRGRAGSTARCRRRTERLFAAARDAGMCR